MFEINYFVFIYHNQVVQQVAGEWHPKRENKRLQNKAQLSKIWPPRTVGNRNLLLQVSLSWHGSTLPKMRQKQICLPSK